MLKDLMQIFFAGFGGAKTKEKPTCGVITTRRVNRVFTVRHLRLNRGNTYSENLPLNSRVRKIIIQSTGKKYIRNLFSRISIISDGFEIISATTAAFEAMTKMGLNPSINVNKKTASFSVNIRPDICSLQLRMAAISDGEVEILYEVVEYETDIEKKAAFP